MISFTQNVQLDNSLEAGQLVVVRAQKEGGIGMTAKERGYSCWGDKNTLNIDLADRSTILNI